MHVESSYLINEETYMWPRGHQFTTLSLGIVVTRPCRHLQKNVEEGVRPIKPTLGPQRRILFNITECSNNAYYVNQIEVVFLHKTLFLS